jgi:hypothetical protein
MLREHFWSTSDADEWRRCLPVSRSVFGSLGYAKVCESYRGVTPRLYAVESEHASICHPMLLRALDTLPFANRTTARWDAATPDYTGPLPTGTDPHLAEHFPGLRRSLYRRERIVAEFAHLHPWSGAAALLGEGCTYNRDIVYVDVTLPPEQLYREHFEHACRKNIQKGQREGVRIFTESSDEHLGEFFRIYTGTMQRNQALDRYAFSLDYFKALREELPRNARFVFAEHAGALIAATLYLHDDENAYSFLGGADAEFNHLRPTNLVIWETIQWAHGSGKKRLVLGGGYGPSDGIFRFKATFSKLLQPFYIYRSIHLPAEYAQLERSFLDYTGLKDEDVDYFPSYRSSRAASRDKTTA